MDPIADKVISSKDCFGLYESGLSAIDVDDQTGDAVIMIQRY